MADLRVDERIKQWQLKHPKRPFFSLEFFPPKTELGVVNLYDRFDRFALLNPLWIDVTWGAGGSTSDKTFELCANGLTYNGFAPLMHLTCTNMSETILEETLQKCRGCGIRNILALRGDPPADATDWNPGQGQFKYAVDLVKYIRKNHGDYFCVVVGGYPEGHLENPDPEDDLIRLKEKVDAGADMIITQLFFDVNLFATFLDRCRAIGITVPIVPGVLPIQSYAGFKRFTNFCKTKVPENVLEALELVKDDDQKVKDFGVELAIKMCRQLLSLHVPGLHFYTLNLEVSVLRILDGLNILEIHLPNRELPWRPRGINGRRMKESMTIGESPKTEQLSDSLSPNSRPSTADNVCRSCLEDVRPIFWANRPKSYIYRTAGWDDFPNGRWGPVESPAYGEPFYSMCQDPDDRSIQARREMWGEQIESTEDVIKIFINYLKFQTPRRLPWTSESLGDETIVIKKQLIQLNILGLCTINSQPRVNAALSTDPIFGWGPAGGFVYQKSYVEFFCSPELWEHLLKKLDREAEGKMWSFMALNNSDVLVTNVPCGGTSVNAVTWGVFPNAQIRQPTVVDIESFRAWKREAADLWMVEWAAVYQTESPSWKLLDSIHKSWYLVNIVDNNFLAGDLFGDLIDLMSI